MSTISGNALNKGISTTDDQTPTERIIALLGDLNDKELADIHEKVLEEAKRRISTAEETVAARKKIFSLLNRQSISQNSRKTSSNEPGTIRIPKKKASPKGTRSPHGEIKKAVLAFLEDEPKGRKQIETHLSGLGLPTQSIGTLLSRLKKEAIIEHDEANKVYSKKRDESNLHEHAVYA